MHPRTIRKVLRVFCFSLVVVGLIVIACNKITAVMNQLSISDSFEAEKLSREAVESVYQYRYAGVVQPSIYQWQADWFATERKYGRVVSHRIHPIKSLNLLTNDAAIRITAQRERTRTHEIFRLHLKHTNKEEYTAEIVRFNANAIDY